MLVAVGVREECTGFSNAPEGTGTKEIIEAFQLIPLETDLLVVVRMCLKTF